MLPNLGWLSITERRSGAIRLTAPDAQPEPRNMRRVKSEVLRRWGTVPLVDVLKETVLRTGSFADTRQARGVPRPADVENPRRETTTTNSRRPDILDAVLFGYARVSTADQNPDHQIDALTRAGVAANDIYVDHATGTKASRPQLDNVRRMLRDGDTLTITRLERLGRSVLHLVILGAELRRRGVGLHVIEQGIDTTTPEGRAMFGMLSVLAELQRELIVANTRDGLAAARPPARHRLTHPDTNRHLYAR